MHELSLCRSILKIIEERSRAQGFRRVDKIYLEMGTLACVDRAALEFCFEAAAKDTLVEHAVLCIVEKPGDQLQITGLEVE